MPGRAADGRRFENLVPPFDGVFVGRVRPWAGDRGVTMNNEAG